MGNSMYKSHCQFSISLDHDSSSDRSNSFASGRSIVAGSVLRGKVTMKVKRPLPTTTKLELRLTGKEKARVSVKKGKHRHTERAERSICYSIVTLRNGSNSDAALIPGHTYVFPFEMVLSESLPSSMDTNIHHRSFCTIVYKLKVDATADGNRTHRGIIERFLAVASAPLPDMAVPAAIAPHNVKVKSPLRNRGSIALAARVVDVHVGRGTNLQVFLACRNYATASIYRVEMALSEMVEWTAQYGLDSQQHGGNSGCRRTLERTIAKLTDVNLPGLFKEKQNKDSVRQQLREGGVSNDELAVLYQDLQSPNNQITMQVPMACRDSYRGSILAVSHMLTITTLTKSGVSDPCIHIPLQIGFAPIVTTPSPPPPNVRTTFATPPVAVATPTPVLENNFATPVSSYPMAQTFVPNLPDTTIPMAQAVVIPIDSDSAIEASMATAPMVLGGVAHYNANVQSHSSSSMFLPTAPFEDSPEPPPSMERLLQEMTYSINDYQILVDKLSNASWQSLLSNMTPSEYGAIVAHVNRDADQPRVAELLARELFVSVFTCEHGRAAAQNAAEWTRATTVQRILPFCVDLATHYGRIWEVLSDWDQTVLRLDLDRLLAL